MMLESKQTHLQFFVLTIFFLYWHPMPITAKPLEMPQHWGELKKEWVACKDGKSQSPIDLIENHRHKPSDATLKNEGHYIALEWEGDAGSIQINGTEYFLNECHWHPILFIRYDLELHMVHRSADKNSVAVTAFLYQVGPPNPFLLKVNKDILSMIGTKEKQLGVINPRDIIWRSLRFYRYIGSLTTPLCTEGVIWTVNERIQHFYNCTQNHDLLQEGKSLTWLKPKCSLLVIPYAVMNARPLQPANGRGIKLYVPSLPLSDEKVPHTTIKAASSPQDSINAASPKSSQSPKQGNHSSQQTVKLSPQVIAFLFAYLLFLVIK
ncbi:alpha carbonic anhydrase 4-like [Pyrus ussuriensis x Pyrus communis]|uniref:Alpha carbonic anhydrase 4-like n=1 Tax=Pyrus ussuriensis x Pyrus communis TaxID=2448454 RepID=A0A5N5HST9_9ROSA|nr:alpha carbonic anhydrase 4-like [Pyrus ussuriensis x Pyrus communis]